MKKPNNKKVLRLPKFCCMKKQKLVTYNKLLPQLKPGASVVEV